MKRILVIEDDDAIRENTAELLAINNYNVDVAQNGSTGYEKAKNFAPDIILCDMMMPETDGRAFLHLAKNDKDLRNTPVVFFSAGTPPLAVQKILINSSNGFLKKPFLEEDLLNAISEVLAE